MAAYISITYFLIYLGVLFMLQKKGKSFNMRVVADLFGGIILDVILKTVADDIMVSESLRQIGLAGTAYTELLKMMVIPLIFISIVRTIINQRLGKSLGEITVLVPTILLFTTAVTTVAGGVTATTFSVSAEGLEIGEAESKKISQLGEKTQEGISFKGTIIDIIPSNPIYALAGRGNNAALSVVFFAASLGIGVIGMRAYAPEQMGFFGRIMNSSNTLVVEVVMMVIVLTPFGIFSLVTKAITGSDYTSILRLVTFVLAFYTTIFVMFAIRGLIPATMGVNPLTHFKKAMTTLISAFTPRASAGTLPLAIRILTDEMGVGNGVPNLADSLGTSIRQNECAAIYPATLMVTVAPTVEQPITPFFFILMAIIVTSAPIGIASVDGGATFAGITVLSVLGFPVGITDLLVGVESVIDMTRTTLNVSNGMATGLVAARPTKNIDINVRNDKSVNLEKKPTSSGDQWQGRVAEIMNRNYVQGS